MDDETRFGWRDTARQAGVDPLFVLLGVRDQWPLNDQSRRPDRTRDLDRLLREDPAVVSPLIRTAIETAARRQEVHR